MENYLFIGTVPKGEMRPLPVAKAFVAYRVQRRKFHEGKVTWLEMLQVFQKRDPGYVFLGYMLQENMLEEIASKGFTWEDILVLE